MKALVVGCGPDVWQEVALASQLCKFDQTYCVKQAGVWWHGGPFVWVGLHPEKMAGYINDRKVQKLHDNYTTVAPLKSELAERFKDCPADRRVSYRGPGMTLPASSGIYAAQVAIHDGFDKVVLAGVPMEVTNHFLRCKPWRQASLFLKGFEQSIPLLRDKVRSMSGLTKQVFGVPTEEWLNGKEA